MIQSIDTAIDGYHFVTKSINNTTAYSVEPKAADTVNLKSHLAVGRPPRG